MFLTVDDLLKLGLAVLLTGRIDVHGPLGRHDEVVGKLCCTKTSSR